jgi:hypothetical protein
MLEFDLDPQSYLLQSGLVLSSTIRSDTAHQMYSETANHASLVKSLLLIFWGRLEKIAQIGKCGP